MTEVQGFQIGDIDGCEFVFSRIVGHMLVSWDDTVDAGGWGKVRVIYADGSGKSVTQEEAQLNIDIGEWMVYRR
ncbi:hypothetical protein D3C75_1279250 [compost metagenome]